LADSSRLKLAALSKAFSSKNYSAIPCAKKNISPNKRLSLTKDIRSVQKNGRWVKARLISVGALPNTLKINRAAFKFRKGIKPAVLRNRLRRLLKEALRSLELDLKPGFDFVLVIHAAKEESLLSFKEELKNLFSKLGVLR